MFHPGQRILCIDGDFRSDNSVAATYYQILPEEGMPYTVKEARPPELGGGVTLEEVTNRPAYYANLAMTLEPGFHQDRFILLSEEETSLCL